MQGLEERLMSSVMGDKIKLSVFGESHGAAIGCVIDGFPAGITLDDEKIKRDMQRRAPGRDKTATARKEADEPIILSGILNGKTTGAPIAMQILNTNTKSGDYANLALVPRPSHSDYPAFVKCGGNNDIRGGGHFSGRLTAPIVFAGALAKQALEEKGVKIAAHIKQIGSVSDDCFEKNNISEELLDKLAANSFGTISAEKEIEMRAEIEKARLDGDSVGGIIECAAIGVPAGFGGNMLSTVEGRLASALFGIPAVKGVEFGAGFGFADTLGSEANDEYEVSGGRVALKSNNNGGVLGGITSGAPIVFSVAIKPTPSISKPQQSVNLETMKNETLVISGRHDPCIVPRAVPVVEAMAALTLLDIIL